MKSILRSIIVEKYNLKNGDKISYEKLEKIGQNENVELEDLIIVLGIKRANYIRIKWNKKSETHIVLNENRLTKEEIEKEQLILNNIKIQGRVILKDILYFRNKLSLVDEEISKLLNITSTQIKNLEKEKVKKIKTNEIARIKMKLLKIDLKYISKFKDKMYTKDEAEEFCKQYDVTIDDFCRYINDKPKEYEQNRCILDKNSDGIYIGNKFRTTNEFIEKNYQLLNRFFDMMVTKLTSNKSRKEDLKSAAYEMLIREGGEIEANYKFDSKLMLVQCRRLGKKAMIIEKYSMSKMKPLVIKKMGDVEFSYLDIIGSEEYNPYKMIDNIRDDKTSI